MAPLTRSLLSRMLLGFGLLLTAFTVLGLLSFLQVDHLASLTRDLYEHPFTVTKSVLELREHASAVRLELTGLEKSQEPDHVEAVADKLKELDIAAASSLATIKDRYLGPASDVARLELALEEHAHSQRVVLQAARSRQPAEATASALTTHLRHRDSLLSSLEPISAFALGKASSFYGKAEASARGIRWFLVVANLLALGLGLGITLLTTRAITHPVEALRAATLRLAEGDLQEQPALQCPRELQGLSDATQTFRLALLEQRDQGWIKTNLAQLTGVLQACEDPTALATELLSRVVPLLGAGAGLFFRWDAATQRLNLLASYGHRQRRHLATSYALGEGLVGQCSLEQKTILLTSVPDDYLYIHSGLGEAPPRQILVMPIQVRERRVGVLELATFVPLTSSAQALLVELLPLVGLSLEVLDRNQQTLELLSESRRKEEALRISQEELRAQGEELQGMNRELRNQSEELQRQAEELRASEEELKAQSDALRRSNEALSDKSAALESRQTQLEASQQESERQAFELSLASRYKSEFLANMSHELRTPLNSLLLLSQDLAQNNGGNLTAEQVDSARIVHESGTQLLRLINDILDLSKIEAGKMTVAREDVRLDGLMRYLRRQFAHMAEARGLQFEVSCQPGLPPALRTDQAKLEQILNNLVSNALKFTAQGSVKIQIESEALPAELPRAGEPGLAIRVVDTGVGVAPDKLERIFRAFEQADGSTSRRFGGTGLGLSIALRLAQLLGGDIRVRSVAEQGSTFSLHLPLEVAGPIAPPAPVEPAREVRAAETAREDLASGRSPAGQKVETILVIEDDVTFSQQLRSMAQLLGLRCLQAYDGREGLELAQRYLPAGIILDVGLPEVDGWSVMQRLKEDPTTRAIPVHFISAADERARGLQAGAVGYLRKPVTRDQLEEAFARIRHFSGSEIRQVLIVDDDPGSRKASGALIRHERVAILEAESAPQALDILRRQPVDCLILDLMMPGMDGFELLQQATAERLGLPPVVVYSAKDLTDDETLRLREYTDSIVIKGARSPERLVDEVSLFLHYIQSRDGGSPPGVTPQPPLDDKLATLLQAKTVLVVDDDMRGAFAMSKALRARGMTVLLAQDGRKALAQLADNAHVSVILMDIMMPGMDGYTTLREIRRRESGQHVPIVALTAKAMPGDRERCLEAGADAYLTKPVELTALLEILGQLLMARDGH